MKKTYTKPEVNEIAVEANQAVAACSLVTKGYMLNDQRNNLGIYPSWADAAAAQPDDASSTAYKICPVYHYEYSKKESEWYTRVGSGNWEDWNNNGVFDSGDIINNQVDNPPVPLTTSVSSVFDS